MDINNQRHEPWTCEDGGLKPKMRGIPGTSGTWGCNDCTRHCKFKSVRAWATRGKFTALQLGIRRTLKRHLKWLKELEDRVMDAFPDLGEQWRHKTHRKVRVRDACTPPLPTQARPRMRTCACACELHMAWGGWT